jgi:hypothetical protein
VCGVFLCWLRIHGKKFACARCGRWPQVCPTLFDKLMAACLVVLEEGCFRALSASPAYRALSHVVPEAKRARFRRLCGLMGLGTTTGDVPSGRGLASPDRGPRTSSRMDDGVASTAGAASDTATGQPSGPEAHRNDSIHAAGHPRGERSVSTSSRSTVGDTAGPVPTWLLAAATGGPEPVTPGGTPPRTPRSSLTGAMLVRPQLAWACSGLALHGEETSVSWSFLAGEDGIPTPTVEVVLPKGAGPGQAVARCFRPPRAVVLFVWACEGGVHVSLRGVC